MWKLWFTLGCISVILCVLLIVSVIMQAQLITYFNSQVEQAKGTMYASFVIQLFSALIFVIVSVISFKQYNENA